MDENEVYLYEVRNTIRLHKKFLAEVRQQTELKQGYGLYRDIMELVVKSYFVRGMHDGICPTMRIAVIKKWPYSEQFYIQGGRILLWRDKHNVDLCISFNIDEFAKYLLLTDVETLSSWEMLYYMNGYALSIMERLRMEYPKLPLRKKSFTIQYTNDIEAIRVRMAEILSHYMYLTGKGKSRSSRPAKVIEKMYGMPARDIRSPRYKKIYT